MKWTRRRLVCTLGEAETDGFEDNLGPTILYYLRRPSSVSSSHIMSELFKGKGECCKMSCVAAETAKIINALDLFRHWVCNRWAHKSFLAS